jgi:tetratricopeptide (TPR) repeat protein
MLLSADPEKNKGLNLIPLLDFASKGLDDAPTTQPLAEAQIREVLGTVYRKYDDYTKARQQQTRVLELREQNAQGRDDAAVAEALHNLAATLWWDGHYDEANGYYTRSLAMRRRLFKGDHALVAQSLNHLAACYLKTGKFGEARSLYKEALAMRRRLNGAEHEEVAGSLNNLARCYLDSDDIDQAESLFRESLDMIRKLKGDADTGTAAASQNLAECLLHRAEAAQVAGKPDAATRALNEARSLLDRALAIRTEMYLKGHPLTAATLGWLARASLLAGDIPGAVEWAQKGTDMIRRTVRPDHPDVAKCLATQGSVLLASGDAAGAAKALEEALTVAERAHPRMEIEAARIRGELGLALAQSGRPEDAQTAVVRGLTETRAVRGDSSLDTVLAARRVLRCSRLIGKPAATEELRRLAKSGS